MKTSVVLTLLSCVALLLTAVDARPSHRQLLAGKDTKEVTEDFHVAAENFLQAMEKVSGKKNGTRQLRDEEQADATNEDTKQLAGKSSRQLSDTPQDVLLKGLKAYFDNIRASHNKAKNKNSTTSS